MKTPRNITRLRQSIARIDNQVQREKKRQRALDTTRKKQLGKLFLLAGIGKYFQGVALPLHQVIQLGAFLIIAKISHEKRNLVLGALAHTCNACQQPEQKKAIAQRGENYFDDKKKLEGPLALALGIALTAAKNIPESNNLTLFKKQGEHLFEQHQIKQLLKRKTAALEKIQQHTQQENHHGKIQISTTH